MKLKSLHIKGNNNKSGRKIFANYTPDRGVIFRIYEELQNVNTPQNDIMNIEQTVLREETKWPRNFEIIFVSLF